MLVKDVTGWSGEEGRRTTTFTEIPTSFACFRRSPTLPGLRNVPSPLELASPPPAFNDGAPAGGKQSTAYSTCKPANTGKSPNSSPTGSSTNLPKRTVNRASSSTGCAKEYTRASWPGRILTAGAGGFGGGAWADAFACEYCIGLEEEEEDVPVRCGGEGGVEVMVQGTWACALSIAVENEWCRGDLERRTRMTEVGESTGCISVLSQLFRPALGFWQPCAPSKTVNRLMASREKWVIIVHIEWVTENLTARISCRPHR